MNRQQRVHQIMASVMRKIDAMPRAERRELIKSLKARFDSLIEERELPQMRIRRQNGVRSFRG